jgi:hypothetical protein
MIKQTVLIFYLSIALLCGLVAQDASVLLGQNPAQVIRLMGAPDELASVNLTDDLLSVVFVYHRGLSLYWLDNQVVQVIYQRAYRGAVVGAFMGASQLRVEQNLGMGEITERAGHVIYQLLNEHNRPMIASLIFEQGVLVQVQVQLSE